MSFLNAGAIAAAAALTIPPLIAMYFLKLKRTVYAVPSTLLWKRAVEDLHVNAPFQRLRSSLLLILQLLVLVLGALALGKPMFQAVESHKDTVILLIDQSASMDVLEKEGGTRLALAKRLAKREIDNLGDDARAMVIAFCDRATVVSSFDMDRSALKRKIDSIEQTQSSSSLVEALSLAEAYTQNIIIGGEEAGSDRAPESAAAPATVFVFTDGRIEDADKVSLQKFDINSIKVFNVGTRNDNVGIIAMQARRHYERPEILSVAATIQNFGSEAVSFDAVLYVDGRNVDIQSVVLAPASADDAGEEPAPGSVAVAVFDEIEFGGGGIVEVVVRIDDALAADNRAWTIVEEPRHIRVLLVTEGNWPLSDVLGNLPLELVTMTPSAYEAANDDRLLDGRRSAFDVVMLDHHSTARLPQGNYFFWGCVPEIDGVRAGAVIENEIVFNWDETHPVLRHVFIETLIVYEWLTLDLPASAESIIDGQTSSILAYMTRDASQFLISAFGLFMEGDPGDDWVQLNTPWVLETGFVVFVQNAVQFLSSNVSTMGRKGVRPGEPVTVFVESGASHARVRRPDQTVDRIPLAGSDSIHYARTRQVGTYHVEPEALRGSRFAVNLFNATESRVDPAATILLGAQSVAAVSGTVAVNKPAWQYFLLALLVLLLLEWIVYNRRVFV